MQFKEDMLRVGVITQTHGLKGEVKIFPTTDDVKRFDYIDRVFLKSVSKGIIKNENNELIELHVTGAKYFKQYVILKFDGINDINDVMKYKGMEIYVAREDAIPLEEGEYYISDLIGLRVTDEEENEIGTLKDVMQTGANDVYVVDGNESYDNKEILKNNNSSLIKGTCITGEKNEISCTDFVSRDDRFRTQYKHNRKSNKKWIN